MEEGIGTNKEGSVPTKKEFNILTGIVYFILIIVLIGFITLILQYFSSTQSTFEELKTQVVQKNEIIQKQEDAINNIYVKLNELTNEIKIQNQLLQISKVK